MTPPPPHYQSCGIMIPFRVIFPSLYGSYRPIRSHAETAPVMCRRRHHHGCASPSLLNPFRPVRGGSIILGPSSYHWPATRRRVSGARGEGYFTGCMLVPGVRVDGPVTQPADILCPDGSSLHHLHVLYPITGQT